MAKIVTIKSSHPAVVISERIGDRERFENGRDELVPDVEQDFLVHEGQSLRIEALPEIAPAEENQE
jgi:hypothetical protein